MEIRTVIVICQGCHGERTFKPDEPLRSAQELMDWTKTALTPCGCGATHCDLKIPMPEVTKDSGKKG